MKTFKRIVFLTLILMTCSLQSCGFALRNQRPLPPEMTTLAIETTLPHSLLALQTRQILRSLGIDIQSDPRVAPFTLRLFDEQFQTKTLSKSASAVTKEYTLTYHVSYELRNRRSDVIFGPKTITVSRNYMINEDQVVSSGNELATLSKEMQRDAMYQMLNQLSSEEVAETIQDALQADSTLQAQQRAEKLPKLNVPYAFMRTDEATSE